MMQLKKLVVPALGLAALLSAQDVVKDIQVEVRHGGTPAMMEVAPQTATFQFIAAEPGFLGKVIAGAPYSGEGFTEMVQTLADGTRISNKNSKRVWRDSQGRTREEGTLPMLGPWAAQGGEAPKFITIADPVAKVVYTLNEKDKTAMRRKMPDFEGMIRKMGPPNGGKAVFTEERHEVVVGGAAQRADVMFGAAGAGPHMTTMARSIHLGEGGKEEALGTQTMEGLKVEGKRLTHTIAAGEVGNDRALVSVTERWNSPELQVLVRMTAKDPQMGETTYRLNNISRAEPAASLFQVPADYTVKEANERMLKEGAERVFFERKIEQK